jgi:succinate dehydrogenase flavin-adding protein (antitoxin of CptAB toxin-antitoxin module)
MSDRLSKGRLRWHCRRGLLELDLAFERFLKTHFDTLDEEQYAALADLLDYDDIELWAIVSGNKECSEPHLRGLVDQLRGS